MKLKVSGFRVDGKEFGPAITDEASPGPPLSAEDLAARVIMDALPTKIRERIRAATLEHGLNRKSKRITGALVKKGLGMARRRMAKVDKRLVDREVYADEMALRVASLGRPLKGMSAERYEELMNRDVLATFPRSDSRP